MLRYLAAIAVIAAMAAKAPASENLSPNLQIDLTGADNRGILLADRAQVIRIGPALRLENLGLEVGLQYALYLNLLKSTETKQNEGLVGFIRMERTIKMFTIEGKYQHTLDIKDAEKRDEEIWVPKRINTQDADIKIALKKFPFTTPFIWGKWMRQRFSGLAQLAWNDQGKVTGNTKVLGAGVRIKKQVKNLPLGASILAGKAKGKWVGEWGAWDRLAVNVATNPERTYFVTGITTSTQVKMQLLTHTVTIEPEILFTYHWFNEESLYRGYFTTASIRISI